LILALVDAGLSQRPEDDVERAEIAIVTLDLIARLPKMLKFYAEGFPPRFQHPWAVEAADRALLKHGKTAQGQVLYAIAATDPVLAMRSLAAGLERPKALRTKCIAALVQGGDPVVEAVIPLLSSSKKGGRAGAAEVLTLIGSEKAMQALSLKK